MNGYNVYKFVARLFIAKYGSFSSSLASFSSSLKAYISPVAMIWITMGLAKVQDERKWGLALVLSLSALVIINPFLAPYACIYLSVAAFVFYLRNKKLAALWLFAGMLVAGAWLLFLSAINFY